MDNIGPAMENTSIAIIEAVRSVGGFMEAAGVTAVVDQMEVATKGFLTQNLPAVMKFWDSLFSTPHPYVKDLDLPLMNPFHVMLIIAVYIVTILMLKLVMSSREKFTLKWFSLVHNTFLMLLSAFMCAEALRNAINLNYGLFGNYSQFRPAELPMARIVWVFYVSKIPEMIDTVIMALKKNNHQISFLHQYHHVSIFIIWNIVTWNYPCGEAYFSIIQNSFVHVVMYGYYAGATFGYQPWWKRHITQLQMLQFFLNMVQAAYDVWVLKVDPAWLMQLLFWYMITLLILFYNYLRQQDKSAKKPRADASAPQPQSPAKAKGPSSKKRD